MLEFKYYHIIEQVQKMDSRYETVNQITPRDLNNGNNVQISQKH